MDLNDYLGSFAQENVDFATKIIRTKTVGDNYWKLSVYVESDRFVDTSATGWEAVPGVATAKALTVTADDYAQFTNGLLQYWLFDLFANGFTGDVMLVAFAAKADVEDADKAEAVKTQLENAYGVMKPYAYWKTICAGADALSNTNADATFDNLCVDFAKLCAADKTLLSSAPLLPFITSTPETATSDLLYAALSTGNADAFMSHSTDATRNAALYALGLALSLRNNSQTPVGNQFDMWASDGAVSSNLAKTIRATLNSLHIQTWKPVGNNTGNAAAEGAQTLQGTYLSAQWIICYVGYMTKVGIAEIMTQPGFMFTAASYSACVSVMSNQLSQMVLSGRIADLQVSPPAFEALPEGASGEIIIDDAWSATYVDNVRKVSISGTLYIKE